MAYNRFTEYGEIASGTVSTSVDIGTNGQELLINWILLANNSGGDLTATLTGHGGTTTVLNFAIDLKDEEKVLIPGFRSPDGLRLATTGVDYVVCYVGSSA